MSDAREDHYRKAKTELYSQLAESEEDARNGRISSMDGTFDALRRMVNGEKTPDKREELLTFRDAVLDDAPRLLEIYKYYVDNTVITFEWTTPTEEEFRARMRRTMEKYPYIVAVLDGKIAGYACAGPFVGRAAYDWAVEMTIYLDHEARHRGIGRKLYEVMEDVLRRMHVLNLNACIGYPKKDDEYLTKNSAAFHEHLGYRMVGEFHDCGYKFGRWYDMVWMEKLIGEHLAKPAPVLKYSEIKEDAADLLLSYTYL